MSRSSPLSLLLAMSIVFYPIASTSHADDAGGQRPADAPKEAPKDTAPPQPKPTTTPDGKAVMVKPGQINGMVLGLDGKTPIQGAEVSLLDDKGNVLFTSKTDTNGNFSLGDHAEGAYQLKAGSGILPVTVSAGAAASLIKLVLPDDVATGKRAAGGPLLLAGETSDSNGTLVLVVTVGLGVVIGAGAAVGILWATDNIHPHKLRRRALISPANPIRPL